ncbi:hypothetical protein [Salinibacter ruber]|uniref:hypothetical protein n=2 Tax=Salinibacter ruber TaxID=146919 RepID=UPI002167A7D0|nr:hypothetical protein [Salinibacter ruber]MCS3702592.1 hypothetical protein [Salinibacter ruber]
MVDIFCEPCRFDICTPRFAQAVGIPEVTRRGLCIWDCSDIIIGYASGEKISFFFGIERMSPMYEHLFSRFTEEFKGSLEDPDIHLSYTDRQRIKGGEYAEVAEEKLPTLNRRIWWIRIYAAVAAVLLAVGTVFVGISGVGDGANWTLLGDFTFPLFLSLCMGFAALGIMWRMLKRMLKLEKQRLLCKLVVAYSEEEAIGETEKAAA